MAVTRSTPLPVYTIRLEGFNNERAAVELVGNYMGKTIEVKIGEQKVSLAASDLLKAVSALTK